MSPKVIAGLAVLTVIVTVGAVWAALERPSAKPVQMIGEPAFPELRERPDAVAKIIITTAEGTITLVRAAPEKWVMAERFEYPGAADKIRKLVVDLADMRLVEPKTARPELYARLEVEDIDSEDAKSRLIRLEDAEGNVLAEALIGKRRYRLTGVEQSGTYLRRPGEPRSWLASGAIELNGEIKNWLDQEIVSIDGDDIRRVEVTLAEGPGYVLSRGERGGELRLEDLAEDEELKEDADFDRVASALSRLRLEDVKPWDKVEWPEAQNTVRYTTFDGLELTVTVAEIEGEPWARFEARQVEAVEPVGDATSEAAEETTAEGSDEASEAAATTQAEDEDAEQTEVADNKPLDAETLNARVHGWAYRIPKYVFNRLTTARSTWLAGSDETS